MGHKQPVEGHLELDEGRLLTWSGDGSLRLWNLEDGAQLAKLDQGGPVSGAQRLDGPQLLSWSGEGDFSLWDLEEGASLARLDCGSGEPLGFEVLDNGNILTLSADGPRVWEPGSGKQLHSLTPGDVLLGSRLFESGRLVCWWEDGTVQLWDVQEGKSVATFEGHRGVVQGAEMLDQDRLLTWATPFPVPPEGQDSEGVEFTYTGVGFNGKASSRKIAELIQQNPEGEHVILTIDGQKPWHEVEEVAHRVRTGEIRVWHLQSGALLSEFDQRWVEGVALLESGRLVSWSGRALHTWDARLCRLESTQKANIRELRVLDDHRVLTLDRGSIRLWDLDAERKQVSHMTGQRGQFDIRILSDDTLASWGGRTLQVWDLSDGSCVARMQGHRGSISGLHELDDGRLLTWSEDGTVRLW
jgi:WD40 repeat protein